MRSIRALFLAGAMSAVAANGLAASFTPLGHFHDWDPTSTPFDVSPDGSTVVGDSNVHAPEGFIWDRTNGMRPMAPLDGIIGSAHPHGVSLNGSVVVGRSTYNGESRAIIWDAATGTRELGGPSGGFREVSSTADAVSRDGTIVAGTGHNADGNNEAFRWDATNGKRGLGDLPGGAFYSYARAISADGSVVVGNSRPAVGISEAFVWDEVHGMRGLGDFRAEYPNRFAHDVSADGSTVVGVGSILGGSEAFIWDEEHGLRGLGDLPGGLFKSRAQGVSADGSIVVGMSYSATGNEAFIWDEEHGMRELDVLLTSLGVDLNGWTLVEAMTISDDGSIVAGYGVNPVTRQEEAWIAVIPEPGVPLLIVLGLAGLSLHGNPAARASRASALRGRR